VGEMICPNAFQRYKNIATNAVFSSSVDAV
jgi:hypothetical protein